MTDCTNPKTSDGVVVGTCCCGGYGVVLHEEAAEEAGRCHVPLEEVCTDRFDLSEYDFAGMREFQATLDKAVWAVSNKTAREVELLGYYQEALRCIEDLCEIEQAARDHVRRSVLLQAVSEGGET